MDNQKRKNKSIHLSHSLTGNTTGSNNMQTMLDILKQTTNNTTWQSTNSKTNETEKAGE